MKISLFLDPVLDLRPGALMDEIEDQLGNDFQATD